MRINERLNIVIPLYRDGDDAYAWVHSTPISREVFDSSYMLIAKTFTAIHSEGLGEVGGPKVALNIMRDVGRQMAGPGGDGAAVTTPLMNEIRRLSSVIVRMRDSWETMPLHDAVIGKLLDEDDVVEVENSLAFFTCASRMYPRNQRQDFMDGAARLWGAQMLSLNSTEFRVSLQTPTEIESTGARAGVLLVPS